ncbi:MAG: AI-2E family transporter [Glaciecola sp.]
MTNTQYTNNKTVKRCAVVITSLAVLYTAYLAQDIILLLLVVALVSLLLSPGTRMLASIRIPRVIGASLLLSVVLIPAVFFIAQLQDPIAKWAQELPELSVQVSDKIDELNQVIEESGKTEAEKQANQQREAGWFDWFQSEPEPSPVEKNDQGLIQERITESVMTFATDFLVSTPFVFMQIVTAIILILFTLVYSPALFRHFVRLFVQEDKREYVNELAAKAQLQLSKYIISVSAVNFCLGLLAILYLYAVGSEDAILLGALIGVLNFIPYVGPLLGLGLLALDAFVQWGASAQVIIAVCGVLSLNVLESQLITPMVLSQQMQINPFFIIIWLLLCGWIWGLVGVLIAVPLIVCIKLAMSQFGRAEKWVKLLET